MQLPGRRTSPPYSVELAREAAEDPDAHWDPLAAATLAQFFNEHFGQGTATYDYIAHDMPFDEYAAWWAYFARARELKKARDDQREHDDLLRQAAKASSRR